MRPGPLSSPGRARYNRGGAGNGKSGRAMLNWSTGFGRKSVKHFVGATPLRSLDLSDKFVEDWGQFAEELKRLGFIKLYWRFQ